MAMNNFSFLPFLLTIIAVIGGVAGITFLIIGLIQSQRKYWLPGAISFVISVIIGLIGMIFSINSFISTVSHNVNKLKNMKSENYVYSDTSDYSDVPVDTSFAVPVSGFIEDKENSLVYIKVFPKKNLLSKNISLEKVEKGNSPNKIALVLNFNKDFSGNLILVAFDYEKHELGKSEISIQKRSGERSNLNFQFHEDINFSVIDYCTLINE
jgi:hypothetical protein